MSNQPPAAAVTPFVPPSHAIQAQAPRSRAHSPTSHTSSLLTHAGQAMAQGSVGSQTQTQTNTDTRGTTAVLRLRGAHEPRTRRAVQWAEDVVDNEGLGRKSSKVCCIYHAPKAVGESSSDDDSSSGSESNGSDSGVDDGATRMVGAGGGRGKTRRRRSGHRHEDGHRHGNGHEHGGDCGDKPAQGRRRPSPNAYEKMPKTSTRRDVRK